MFKIASRHNLGTCGKGASEGADSREILSLFELGCGIWATYLRFSREKPVTFKEFPVNLRIYASDAPLLPPRRQANVRPLMF